MSADQPHVPELPERDTDLKCRVQVTLETPEGEVVVDLSVEDRLVDAMSQEALPGLLSRVDHQIENRTLPELRRRLADWVEPRRCPSPSTSFEQEYARRCDHNGEVVASMEWVNPVAPTDAELQWMERLARVFVAREANDQPLR